MKRLSLFMLTLGILSTIMFVTPETLAGDTTVYVKPPVTTFDEVEATFQINISISEVTDLAGWDFKLYYPSLILNATNIIEGPFINPLEAANKTFFHVNDFTDSFNATHGRIWAACTLIGQEAGADGNGILATIAFKAVSRGTANLHLTETDLIDSKMPPNHIPHATVDGTVNTIPWVSVPATTYTEVGGTFQINISISEVTDLAGWDFKLYYPSLILNATNIIEGPFLETAGGTFFLIDDFTDSYNATHGRVWAACTLIGQEAGADGNGILATITFKAVSIGVANLHLAETDLIDSKMPPNHIPHATVDGTVNTGNRDIAITSVTVFKTIVGQGHILHMNVTTRNEGNLTENFNVTAYADMNTTTIGDEITIGIQNITLTSGNSTTITLTWDTTGVAKGNYTVTAYATPVSGETDTADNTLFADKRVCVSIPGDLDCDRDVDLYDAVKLLVRYGAKKGQPEYDPNCDIDGDGDIDLYDAVALLINYGQKDL